MVLINPRNHHLNGRNLVVEYASPDAVRRGAPKTSRPADGTPVKGRKPLSAGYKKTRTFPTPSKYKTDDDSRTHDGPAAKDEPHNVNVEADVDPKKRREKKEGRSPLKGDKSDGFRHKGPKSRPKPGAALALAKRESAAILPSQGQKITF